MIVDTSAVIAVLLREPGHEVLEEKLVSGGGIGAPTLVEAGLVLGSRIGGDPTALLDSFLERTGLRPVAFGEAHWHEAIRAQRRFGRGRHPARLNFGDCLSYAAAKVAGEPLLYIGGDFALTDIDAA